MRLIKGFITIVGIIGILVIIALVMGYYLFCLTPGIQAKITPVAVTAEAAQSFDQKLEAFQTQIDDAVSAGQEIEVSLTVTEKEVNSKFIEVLAEGELPLEQMLINFRDGHFLAYAVVDIPGVAAKTGTIGKIQVSNGDPNVVIEDFDLGKLPLPQAATSATEDLLNIMVRLNLADLPLKITAVEISNGRLIVTGLTKTAD